MAEHAADAEEHKPSLGDRIKRVRAWMARDDIRIPLQTTGAVLLAFGAGSFMGAANMSWAVFSALFVVQASIGGTVRSALHRMAGAALGAAVGVAAVMLPGQEAPGMLLSLWAGVSVMSVIAVRWPNMAYGLVTVTIIIVAPDLYVLEGAVEKIIAIGIGSVCGTLAAVAVFPVSARRRADRHLGEALRACGELLQGCVRCLVDGEDRDDQDADSRISQELSRARDMAGQASAERAPMATPDGSTRDLVYEVERFRYTLTLVDRFSDRPLPESLRGDHRDRLKELAETASKQIEEVASAIAARTACEPVEGLQDCFDHFAEGIEHTLQHTESDKPDRERLIAIKEAFAAMLDNLSHMCGKVDEKYGE